MQENLSELINFYPPWNYQKTFTGDISQRIRLYLLDIETKLVDDLLL